MVTWLRLGWLSVVMLGGCGLIAGVNDFTDAPPTPGSSASGTGGTGGNSTASSGHGGVNGTGGVGAGGIGAGGTSTGGNGTGGASGTGGAPPCVQNGAKDGNETDVDCGGTNCIPCTTGMACLAPGDCTTGYCADKVCCNEACDGVCEACTIQKKGIGSDGICGAIVNGLDPDLECNDPEPDVCNGSRVCRCHDGVKNAIEFCIDCGGGQCNPCAGTWDCNGCVSNCNSTCTMCPDNSANCDEGSTCSPPSSKKISAGWQNDGNCGGSACCLEITCTCICPP